MINLMEDPTLVILALEVLGILVALYLIVKRRRNQHPVCIIGENCNVVLGSKYNKIFGIAHNDVMGLLYYIAMIGILLLFKFYPAGWQLLSLKLLAGSGAIMAATFMYIQWQVLKAWCFWCIVSNVNNWIIALIIFKYL